MHHVVNLNSALNFLSKNTGGGNSRERGRETEGEGGMETRGREEGDKRGREKGEKGGGRRGREKREQDPQYPLYKASILTVRIILFKLPLVRLWSFYHYFISILSRVKFLGSIKQN